MQTSDYFSDHGNIEYIINGTMLIEWKYRQGNTRHFLQSFHPHFCRKKIPSTSTQLTSNLSTSTFIHTHTRRIQGLDGEFVYLCMHALTSTMVSKLALGARVSSTVSAITCFSIIYDRTSIQSRTFSHSHHPQGQLVQSSFC